MPSPAEGHDHKGRARWVRRGSGYAFHKKPAGAVVVTKLELSKLERVVSTPRCSQKPSLTRPTRGCAIASATRCAVAPELPAPAKRAAIMGGCYTHARQFRRARRELKFLRTPVGAGDPRHPPQDRRQPAAHRALCRPARPGGAGALCRARNCSIACSRATFATRAAPALKTIRATGAPAWSSSKSLYSPQRGRSPSSCSSVCFP
jgi:hypothetical protein